MEGTCDRTITMKAEFGQIDAKGVSLSLPEENVANGRKTKKAGVKVCWKMRK
jgi:hypothetical protein